MIYISFLKPGEGKMMHPTIIQKNGEIRYQALLQEAEAYRQRQSIKGNRLDVRQHAGDFLIALGQ